MKIPPRWLLALFVVFGLVAGGCGDDTDEGAEGANVVIAGEVDTNELYGIGVPTESDNLTSAINAALAEIVEDGTYEEIYDEWFPGGDVEEQIEAITAAADGGELGDPSSYELRTEGELLVGSDIAFAPFEFVEDGENRGFDIDLMNEIAERLGVEVEFVNAGFDTIFTQLASGAFDAIISGITITEERDEQIDFSDPYFLATQGIAVLEDSGISGVDDLAGASVAVQTGTTGEAYAQDNFADAEIVSYPTSEAAFAALVAGQVDAVFIDLPVASAAAEGDALEPTGTES